jgi:hypothetical protein
MLTSTVFELLVRKENIAIERDRSDIMHFRQFLILDTLDT